MSDTSLDCGDSSCIFAEKTTGMRTNSRCRCLDSIESAYPQLAQDIRRAFRKLEQTKEFKAALNDLKNAAQAQHFKTDTSVLTYAAMKLRKYKEQFGELK